MIRFARDESGAVKTKKPCETPGCTWPNWHICLVGKPDTTDYAALKRVGRAKMSERTEAHRETISQVQRDRYARLRELQKQRDKMIVDRYAEGGIGISQLMKEFDLGHRVISRVLHEAEDRGEIKMRRPGYNIRHGY